MEVSNPIRGPTFKWRSHLSLESHLKSEVRYFGGNFSKGVEQTWGMRRTCLHVLMHVDILTKVWVQKWADWDMHKRSHRSTHICVQVCERMEQVWGHMDMHTCTDTCSHSNQSVGPDEGRLKHSDRATQGCTCL